MDAGESKSSPSQKAYHARERQSRKALEQATGRKWSIRELRRVSKEQGWRLPGARGARRTPAQEEAERRFIAGGLNRPERAERDYYRSHY